MHLGGWGPTVALAAHIAFAPVAGLGLVGGAGRPSRDAKLHYRRTGESVNRNAFLRFFSILRTQFALACASASVRNRVSARADRSSSLMSAAWSGGWSGSR